MESGHVWGRLKGGVGVARGWGCASARGPPGGDCISRQPPGHAPAVVTLRGKRRARWDLESRATWCGGRQAAEAGSAPGVRGLAHVG